MARCGWILMALEKEGLVKLHGKTKMNNKSNKELIKEYVDDHYKNFKFYPMDVEVHGKIYDYKSYMEILNND